MALRHSVSGYSPDTSVNHHVSADQPQPERREERGEQGGGEGETKGETGGRRGGSVSLEIRV